MRAREVLNCQMNLSEMSGEGSSFNGQHSGLSAWLQIGAQEWGIPGASWPSKHERKNMVRALPAKDIHYASNEAALFPSQPPPSWPVDWVEWASLASY